MMGKETAQEIIPTITRVTGDTPNRYQVSHQVRVVSGPPKPTLLEIYLYDPLEYIVWNFLKLNIGLLALAVFFDMIG